MFWIQYLVGRDDRLETTINLCVSLWINDPNKIITLDIDFLYAMTNGSITTLPTYSPNVFIFC